MKKGIKFEKNKIKSGRGRALALSLVICMLLAGCGSSETGKEQGDTTTDVSKPEIETQEQTVVETPVTWDNTETLSRDGITITITTDKASYNQGETVNYKIKIDNEKPYWQINSFEFSYNQISGFGSVDGNALPAKFDIIKPMESAEISGSFTAKDGESIGGPVDKKATTSNEYVRMVMRPYVRFTYAGEEKTLTTVMELHVMQQKINFASSERLTTKKVSCHDPSIFKDFDGKYYIFGSHLDAGMSDDLTNWTDFRSKFLSTFTAEVKEQIRAWNKDEKVSNWEDYLWAPDIIYNTKMQKYCMYLSANGDDWKSNIVLLTADKVTGPYAYAGSVVYGGFSAEDYSQTDVAMATGETTIAKRYETNGVKNRRWGDAYPNCIDPCVYYDDEGNLRMIYGSWSGGIFLLELDEETGLRDYGVSYEDNAHSDPYFGKKIAGGRYVSGEGAYIQKIGDYYYLFVSYGGLEAKGGYNVRIFRSRKPDGDFVDELGNTPFYDKYELNINQSVGVRLFGGYKWRTFSYGQVAQGHNSAFVDDDGRAFIIYHTRTTNGSEGHTVMVHQLFLNKEGWLVAAPYQTNGEVFEATRKYTASEVSGQYELILHDINIDYAGLEAKKPKFCQFNEDGTITGEYNGTWEFMGDSAYIYISINDVCYSGLMFDMKVEGSNIETTVFTALGDSNQFTLWGSKSFK